ncbi:MAG TPA: alpha-xylosidase [Marinilabiliales bacterium]|jgi:alpha-D-xyloside xylohydrolase|nr:alpha-xylosidase [Marinilabiliales bacterium]
MKKLILTLLLVPFLSSTFAQLQEFHLQNEPIDISPDFANFQNTYYLADSLTTFNAESGQGKLVYHRYEYATRMAFNNMLGVLRPVKANEFPVNEYQVSPELGFSVEFVSERTVRIRAQSGSEIKPDEPSLMLVNGIAPADKSWTYTKIPTGHQYTSKYGKVVIETSPWHVKFFDATGKQLTSTIHFNDVAETTYTPVLPFSFVRRASDYSRSFSAVFTLSPDEKIFGCGESYTALNKRGQKVVLWVDDANGIQNETMYKPIPFYMSSRGYGVFMHTSAPVTCDFGKYFGAANSMMIGDESLDLFVFLGEPKDILNEYTHLTGKAEMPPLWSFGYWQSRITYFSQEEGLAVADKLRVNRIPADVLHFDTGWFETDWQCDYQFSTSRFKDPTNMIQQLNKQGIKTCLWQLPYFVPKNNLFAEIINQNLYVKNGKGTLPYEDAVLDFSNPATVAWYQNKIKGLLDLGVGAIKVDFGEAAPANGIYASGKSGFYEHNLYPLRYNKAVSDITKSVHHERIMWARSAWAGSQRYPLHWGGDPANTNTAMAATLRGGLSFGLSGFAFWSHDIGGFVLKTPENLFRRWTPFGMLTSHTRSHGTPPKEPWEYGDDFMSAFRKADNMRYMLMPYIYAQAKECTLKGLPMVRALFVEFPSDPGSWLIDNEYFFGSDMLVAPLFEDSPMRDVYLPEGTWIDYQTGTVYQGGWHQIPAGEIPIVILVKEGAVIPHIALTQSTQFMDWGKLKLVVYTSQPKEAKGLVCLPENQELKTVDLNSDLQLTSDPYHGKVTWEIVNYNDKK